METPINQTKQEQKKIAEKVGGLLFVGSMFIGMATGWYVNNFIIGLFGGMGIGFILMAVAYISITNKK